jgi:DmsE family decaheme c-type cytochrome
MKRLITLTTVGMISCAVLGTQPASAFSTNGATDPAYAALRDYAQSINIAAPQATLAAEKSDAAYSALASFASEMDGKGVDLTGPVQVAASKPVKAAAAPVTKAIGGEAHMVGSQVCATCHATAAAEFAQTLMGRINRTTRKGQFECESCHGPGSLHVKAGGGRGVGGMNPFRPQTAEEVEANNSLCLACHERGERTAWKGSTHETRGLACTNCHTIMRNVTPKFQLTKQTEPEACFQCHKLQRAQIQRSSHMPIREGKLTCSNCHNPHGSVYGTESLIREASINDNCYKCHADKRGPLLHEHAPVRENCLNCHEAHGSNHEYLLKVQRPRLCAECHSFAHGGQPGLAANQIYAFGHGCNNCHTQIHGSNHPSGAFFLR